MFLPFTEIYQKPLTSPQQSAIISNVNHGALAQLGAHNTGSVGVRGSNPLCSTTRTSTSYEVLFLSLRWSIGLESPPCAKHTGVRRLPQERVKLVCQTQGEGDMARMRHNPRERKKHLKRGAFLLFAFRQYRMRLFGGVQGVLRQALPGNRWHR